MVNIQSNNYRKTFFLSLIAMIFVLMSVLSVISGCKQSEIKSYTVGFVNPNPEEEEGAQGFLRNMPKFGYIEGKNVSYIKCESNDKNVIENAIKDMVSKRVDLIFTITTPATQMAKKHTEGKNIPTVFVLYNAVKSGVVKSLILPEGNLTGVQIGGSTPKALEWLTKIAPGVKNIYVPVCFDTGAARQSLADLNEGAEKLRLKLVISEVKTDEELHSSLVSMPKDIDAVFLLHSWLVASHLKDVIDKAVSRKIPIVSAGHVHCDDGLVMSYGPRDDRTGYQAAQLAHRILQGTSPENMPVETSDFYLGINLKTTKLIGLKIPDDILQQADFIVR